MVKKKKNLFLHNRRTTCTIQLVILEKKYKRYKRSVGKTNFFIDLSPSVSGTNISVLISDSVYWLVLLRPVYSGMLPWPTTAT